MTQMLCVLSGKGLPYPQARVVSWQSAPACGKALIHGSVSCHGVMEFEMLRKLSRWTGSSALPLRSCVLHDLSLVRPVVQALLAYVTLLKVISSRLTPGLVDLVLYPADRDYGACCPLYLEAISNIDHECAAASWHHPCACAPTRDFDAGSRVLNVHCAGCAWQSLPRCPRTGIHGRTREVHRHDARSIHQMQQRRHQNLKVPETSPRLRRRSQAVRAAVRSFTLNLCAVDSPALQSYLADGPAAGFFGVLGSLMTESCQVRGPAASRGWWRKGFGPADRRCRSSVADLHGRHTGRNFHRTVP